MGVGCFQFGVSAHVLVVVLGVALRRGSNIVEHYEYAPYCRVRVLAGYTSGGPQEQLAGRGLRWR